MAAALNVSSCWGRTTSIRAPPTRSSAPSCMPKGSGTKILRRSTPRSATAITRPSSPISKFAAGGKTAVVSTINGDSNVPFYKELANQGLKATDVPVVAFSVGKRSCAASIPNRWSATSRHGTTLSLSITRPTKPSSPIIARMPKRTSCRMPIRW